MNKSHTLCLDFNHCLILTPLSTCLERFKKTFFAWTGRVFAIGILMRRFFQALTYRLIWKGVHESKQVICHFSIITSNIYKPMYFCSYSI